MHDVASTVRLGSPCLTSSSVDDPSVEPEEALLSLGAALVVVRVCAVSSPLLSFLLLSTPITISRPSTTTVAITAKMISGFQLPPLRGSGGRVLYAATGRGLVGGGGVRNCCCGGYCCCCGMGGGVGGPKFICGGGVCCW